MTCVLVHHGTLIDGTGRAPIADARVLIRDGRILSVGPSEGPVPPAVEAIDARGGAILPGFIDCHAHITFEVAGVEAQMRGASERAPSPRTCLRRRASSPDRRSPPSRTPARPASGSRSERMPASSRTARTCASSS